MTDYFSLIRGPSVAHRSRLASQKRGDDPPVEDDEGDFWHVRNYPGGRWMKARWSELVPCVGLVEKASAGVGHG